MIIKLLIKKYLEVGIVISFCFILIALIQSTSAEEIVLNYSFPEPEINEVNISNNISDMVTMLGLNVRGGINLPILPLKPLKILLPQKGLLESINVTYRGNISFGNGYNVTIAKYPAINFTLMGYNISDESYYNSSIPYPTSLYSIIDVGDFRGYSILIFILYPVHYVKDSGEIYYYENMTVRIITNESGSVSPLFRGLETDKITMHQMVDDFSMEDTYDEYREHSHSSIVDPSESFDYVIITTNNLINAAPYPLDNHEWKTFQNLSDYKNETGVITNIVTVDEITKDPYYWGSSPSSLDIANDTQSQIRNFISDAFINWETDYVLLGGDNEIIPARFLYFSPIISTEVTSCPSDLYYSCIHGPFNYTDDEFWGKSNDGTDGGPVDLTPNVYVGRACVSNPREVRNFVSKTLTYEKTKDNDPYLRKILLVGEYMDQEDWWGEDRKDQVVGECDYGYYTKGIPDNGLYTIDRLYDSDPDFWDGQFPWDDENDGWKKSDIKYRINDGEYILNNCGHGDTNTAMKLKSVDTLTFITINFFSLFALMFSRCI